MSAKEGPREAGIAARLLPSRRRLAALVAAVRSEPEA